jgi:hypothetical protein
MSCQLKFPSIRCYSCETMKISINQFIFELVALNRFVLFRFACGTCFLVFNIRPSIFIKQYGCRPQIVFSDVCNSTSGYFLLLNPTPSSTMCWSMEYLYCILFL